MLLHRTPKLLRAGLIALLFLSTVLIATPFAAKLYVEHSYPFVDIGSVKYVYAGLEFKNVVIKKAPLVKATLDSVKVLPFRKHIICSGGNIDVIISNSKKNGSKTTNPPQNWFIQASGLQVAVTKGDLHAQLRNVGYTKSPEKDEFIFESAHVNYYGQYVDVTFGKVPRNMSKLEADGLSLRLKLPVKIPTLDSQHESLEASGITVFVDEHKALVKSFKYGIFSGTNVEFVSDNTEVAVSVSQLSVTHKWLGKSPATFDSLVLAFSLKTKKGVAFVGPSRLRLEFDLTNQTISGHGDCADWVRALPQPTPKALEQVAKSYTGQLDISVAVKPTPDFKLHDSCSFRCSQSPIKDLFDPNGFVYAAYHPDGSTYLRRVGLNEHDWIPMGSIASPVILAVTTLEDPGFQSHRGILPMAIKNSLLANLRTGKFSRGGSTITMQLAKNLWLNRDKTLLRKINEAMLTFALESCLNKEQIIELYLNVVEFGPNIYGIGPAAKHYFNKMPAGLTNDESFFLASILPRPNKAVSPKNGGLARARGLMRMLARNGGLIEGMVE